MRLLAAVEQAAAEALDEPNNRSAKNAQYDRDNNSPKAYGGLPLCYTIYRWVATDSESAKRHNCARKQEGYGYLCFGSKELGNSGCLHLQVCAT